MAEDNKSDFFADSQKILESLTGVPAPYCFFSAANKILFNEFYDLVKDCQSESACQIRNLLCEYFIYGIDDPCAMTKEEQSEMKYYSSNVDKKYIKNSELNNAESLEEIEEVLKKAEDENVPVRDEYKAIFNYVKDLKELKKVLGNSESFETALKAMKSLFEFIQIEYSLDYLAERRKNFQAHNTSLETKFQAKMSDFIIYELRDIEEIWHPKTKTKNENENEKSTKIGLNRAIEIYYNRKVNQRKNGENDNHFFDKLRNCGINPNNKEECIKQLSAFMKYYWKKYISNQPNYEYAPKPRKRKKTMIKKDTDTKTE